MIQDLFYTRLPTLTMFFQKYPMASGVPTILSSIPSYTNFDETRNHSLFVKTSDPESLANAIVKIFNNRTLKEKLVHQWLIVAGKFTKENVLKWKNVTNAVIASPQVNRVYSDNYLPIGHLKCT